MVSNAFKYIIRKYTRSILILLLITIMGISFFLSTILKKGVLNESKNTFKNIQNSFSLNINRRYNMGTNRGAGNIKGEDINKIRSLKEISSYVKRVNSVADLEDKEIIETEETLRNQNEYRRKNFGKAVMLTGVNDSSKETKFISGAFTLGEGRHIKDNDTNVCLVHEKLASKNGLKVGDTLKLKSNIYDADNEKGANERVELKIIGTFKGSNKGGYSYAQELYENNIITDPKSSAKLYGYTEDTAIYEDASFFVSGDKNLDDVIKKATKLDIDWRMYNTIKSTNNFPKLEESINEINGVAASLNIICFIVLGLILVLVIFWLTNTRKKEMGILLSIGISKTRITMQFIMEFVIISILAITLSFFVSRSLGDKVQNKVLSNVNTKIEKQSRRESKKGNLGGGAEAEGFNKTLEKLEGKLELKDMTRISLFVILTIVTSTTLASYKNLGKRPKELISDIK